MLVHSLFHGEHATLSPLQARLSTTEDNCAIGFPSRVARLFPVEPMIIGLLVLYA